MDILLLTNTLDKSTGWSTVGVELGRRLAKEHRLVALCEKGDAGRFEFQSLPVLRHGRYHNPIRLWLDLLSAETAIRTLNGFRFEAILCNIEPLLPIAALIKSRLKVRRLVMIGHGTFAYFPFVKLPHRLLYRPFSRAIDEIVVPSRFTADHVKQWFQRPLHVAPWGVDLQDYRPRAIGMQPSREPAFAFIGEPKARKGFSVILDAIRLLKPDFPSLRIYVTSNQEKVFKRFAGAREVAEHLILCGRVSPEELRRIYSRSIAVVLPSVNCTDSFEGFGLVHLEANACGIPSIGSRGTANEEIILHGRNGLLCRQNDPADLAACMRHMLTDRNSYEKMCRNASAHAASMSWNAAVQRVSLCLRGMR